MTNQEREAKFVEELENLMHKWGVSLNAPYQHTVDGLTVAGNAKIAVTANKDWTLSVPQPHCFVTGCTNPIARKVAGNDYCEAHAIEIEKATKSAPADLSTELPVNDNHKEKIDA